MKNLQISDLDRVKFTKRNITLDSLVRVGKKIFYVECGKLFYFVKEGFTNTLCEDKMCTTELVYIPTLECVWFGTGTEFIFVNVKTYDLNVVAAFRTFFTASWSPDHEFIAVCEEHAKINCYRNCFVNPTPSVNFEDEDNGFLGTNVCDVNITWRANSRYFCVVYLEETYKIRVYNITGQIMVKSLEIPNMAPHVTWRHSLLVVAQRNEGGTYVVSMYEKNGLYRNKFELDREVVNVGKMKWNDVGDVLAIEISTEEGSFLNVYVAVNYQYQLKQQVVSTNKNPMETFDFTQCTKHMIGLFVANIDSITFVTMIMKTQTGTLSRSVGFYADIDGKQLSFKRIHGEESAGKDDAIYTIKLDHPINHVTFHRSFEQFIVVDSYSNIFLYSSSENRIKRIGKKLVHRTCTSNFQPISFYNHYFMNDETVLINYLNSSNAHDLYDLNLSDFEILPLTPNDHIKCMLYVEELKQLLKFKADGIVYLNDQLHLSQIDCDLQQLNYIIVDGELYVLSLDVMDKLRINNNVVCRYTSSFILHQGYLFITAFMNKLYCIRLTKENMENLGNESLFQLRFYKRTCEDGSILLTGICNEERVVVYHTRGNTETVLCRNMALDKLEGYIKAEKWRLAFDYTRIERLDFNLIVDIDPYKFLKEVASFVMAIDSSNLLQLFIQSLIKDNIFKTTYRDLIRSDVIILDNKIQVVCHAILNVVKVDMRKYIKVAILAANGIGGISMAVEIIQYVYNTYGDIANVITDAVSCINRNFPRSEVQKTCLLTGNVPFIECVFEKMNVDPKFYEDLLNELVTHLSNVHRQFFLIHNFIENYKEALEYLVTGTMHAKLSTEGYSDENDIDEMIEYAKRHNIVKYLYKYCVQYHFKNKRIITLYTEKLCSAGRLEEAALIYRANSMWTKALNIFIRCKLWNDALQVMDYLEIDKREYLLVLAASLKAAGNYKDAAYLYERYLHEPELAISCLAIAKLFKEAVHYASKYGKWELLREEIRPQYLTYNTILLTKILDLSQKFKEYFLRLQILRTTAIAALDSSFSMGDEESHNYAESVAGSLRSASTLSRSTFSSSSSRSRRQERKKQSLRSGGTYENIALMRTLHNIVEDAYNLCADVKSLCTLFISHESDGFQMAKLLQDAMSKLLSTINPCITTIWPPNLNSVNIVATPEMTILRHNLDDLEMKFRYAPDPVNANWKLSILDELVDSPVP